MFNAICPTCGKMLGHCAQNTYYANGKESGWHTISVCVNKLCPQFNIKVSPRAAKAAPKSCTTLGFPVCCAIVVHPMYPRVVYV